MKKLLLFALAPISCFALEQDPWFGHCFEFIFRADYSYDFFSKIDHSTRFLDKTQHTHVFGTELELTAPDTWNWQLELELATTTPVSFGYRSFALQVEKLWFDDVCGDPFSLTTGFVYRDVSSRFLRAHSTPYHARANFELFSAIAKEWSHGHCWYFRTFALGAVGQASRGAPWVRGDLTFWGNYCDKHQVRLYVKSYFGFGSNESVSINHFSGWANIRHKSVDTGGSYSYHTSIYGSFRFDYVHRLYAKSYPEHVNFFQLTYELPFCPF